MITLKKFYTDDDSKNTESQVPEFILPGNLEPGIFALHSFIVYPFLYWQLLRGSVFELYSYK